MICTRFLCFIAALAVCAIPASPLAAQSTSIITVAEAVNAFLRSHPAAPRGEYMLYPFETVITSDTASGKRHGDDVLPFTRNGIASVMSDEMLQTCKAPFLGCMNRDRNVLRLSAVQRDSTGMWIFFDLKSFHPPPPASDTAAMRVWRNCCETFFGIMGELELRQVGGHWNVVRLRRFMQYP